MATLYTMATLVNENFRLPDDTVNESPIAPTWAGTQSQVFESIAMYEQ
jgi:hypothetical protein